MNGLLMLPMRGLRQLALGGRPAMPVGVRAGSTMKRYRKPDLEGTKFPPNHGEQIWVFNNIASNQVVYSHTPVLRKNRALKQLPFNGKQTKPASLRKDYWRPLALIQFDTGAGVVGRSVYQKLREFRRLHELSWGHQTKELYALDRVARGHALNDQRANTIADMAAVLGGAGTGNRIQERDEAAAAASGTAGEAKEGKQSVEPKLTQATVFWADEHDRNAAEAWTKNVIHVAGIPLLKPSPETIEA